MPEGDTIHRTAARLRPALVGARLVRFEAPRLVGPRPRPGETVQAVDAVGKHLMVRFSAGLTLETHLRMTGSWHLYRAGQRWTKSPHLMRCLIGVDGWEAVCFSAPVVRTHPTATEGTTADPLGHLGPDLCAERPGGLDEHELVAVCVERMADLSPPERPVGEALLDQRVACGVGNVYRSEVCWHCRVDPRTPVGELDPAVARDLIATARRLLRANLTTADRATVPGGLAVYGRRGAPCRRCGTAVAVGRLGGGDGSPGPRVLYWCPTCQHR